MSHPTILVSGATGRTGAAVVSRLRRDAWPVRALVHSDDHRADELRAQGAEVITADLFNPTSVREAMVGASRAYFTPPWHPHMIDAAVAFAAAARDAHLESVVWMSQWLAAADNVSTSTRQMYLMDEAFAGVDGMAKTRLIPGFFADNYMRALDLSVHFGLFPIPTGQSRNAPPSNEDIARVAVAALMDPARHDGRSYRPTGPDLLSGADMAEVVGRVLDRRVRHWDLSVAMFLKAAKVAGASPFELVNVPYYFEEHRRGSFEVGAPSNDILVATGQPAEPFEVTVTRYAASPIARRGAAAKARASARFMRVGMTRTPDVGRMERTWNMPQLASPRLSIDSPEWNDTHGATAGTPVNE